MACVRSDLPPANGGPRHHTANRIAEAMDLAASPVRFLFFEAVVC
jgi:hypothetical protein